jgi:ABC-type antimicrobial peptide transport system permease subunit
VLINEVMSKKFWNGQNPLGGRISLGDVNAVITGVVQNVVDRSLAAEPEPFIYFAFNQNLSGPESVATDAAHLFVRSSVDSSATMALVAEALRAADPEVPVYDVEPFADRVAALLMTQRMGLTLFSLFGAVALCLATVGVYGVASYVAATRTREIGVRMALGATRSAVRRLILTQNARPLALGIGAGLLLSWYASRTITAFLIEVSPTDPLTFAAVSLVLAAVAAAATYIPARRASRADPMAALRSE